MDTIIHSQQSENRMNETTETDFNSTLFHSFHPFTPFTHTRNTIIDLGDNDQNNNQNNNNNNNHNSTTNTTASTHIDQKYQQRQPVNSTELSQNLDRLDTTIPILPNVNTPLPRLHRQNSVHFDMKPINFTN